MNQPTQPAVSADGQRSKRGVLLIEIAIFAIVVGVGYRVLRYAGMRAALSREISLFNRVQNAILVYDAETGHFPATLDDPQFQRSLSDFTTSDKAFLFRECRLVYTSPSASAGDDYVILRAWTPWGDIAAHKDGSKTYGWKSLGFLGWKSPSTPTN